MDGKYRIELLFQQENEPEEIAGHVREFFDMAVPTKVLLIWTNTSHPCPSRLLERVDEVVAFFGTNPEDPWDLCGEVELWLGDEKHIITKSSLVFIPKGLKHCPLIARRVDRPIFHFTTGPAHLYR